MAKIAENTPEGIVLTSVLNTMDNFINTTENAMRNNDDDDKVELFRQQLIHLVELRKYSKLMLTENDLER